MFVIISGRAEVRIDFGRPDRAVWELQRGDVFGVTSLIRSEERMSDVIALEDVEVLAMDERFRTGSGATRGSLRESFSISRVSSSTACNIRCNGRRRVRKSDELRNDNEDFMT